MRKIKKINICERRALHIWYIFVYLLLLAVKISVKKVNQAARRWLVKSNSFLIGVFIFMLNTDWNAKNHFNVNSISDFYKHLKRNQSSIIYIDNLTDLINLTL